MLKRVLLLPGQGTQFVGMTAPYTKFSWSQEILDRVDQSLGFKVLFNQLSKLMQEGPQQTLNLTQYAQPAIMTSSIVKLIQLRWTYLKNVYGTNLAQFSFILGHSLGEYTGSVITNAISLQNGVKLAQIRGKSMQEAVQNIQTRMCAVASSESLVRQAMDQVKFQGICEIAGINHDKQVVLSGTQSAVDAVSGFLKKNKKVLSKNLNVSAPFHCKLMEPAGQVVKGVLEEIDVKDSDVPIVSNSRRVGLTDGTEIKESLVENIPSPAHFLRGMEYVLQNGAKIFVESGSNKVLTNMVMKIMSDRKLEDIIVDVQ